MYGVRYVRYWYVAVTLQHKIDCLCVDSDFMTILNGQVYEINANNEMAMRYAATHHSEER
jgi:hypothetical protein